MDPVQTPHPCSDSSSRRPDRRPGRRAIWRQLGCGLLLDPMRRRPRPETQTSHALCDYDRRRHRPTPARLGRQIEPLEAHIPNPSCMRCFMRKTSVSPVVVSCRCPLGCIPAGLVGTDTYLPQYVGQFWKALPASRRQRSCRQYPAFGLPCSGRPFRMPARGDALISTAGEGRLFAFLTATKSAAIRFCSGW